MRPLGLRQMLPLREPQISMGTDALARHGEFLGIGHAVDPDGPRAQHTPDPQSKITRCGPGGEHYVRTLAQQDVGESGQLPQKSEFLPAIGLYDRVKAGYGLAVVLRILANCLPEVRVGSD